MKKEDVVAENLFTFKIFMKKITLECWNCSSIIKNFSFFCCKCLKIQRPIEVDIFKIFGLPYNFSVDLEKLELKYYNLQSKLHPDRFINSSPEESYFSQIHSSNLNSSFEKLKDTVKRSEELLKILDFKVDKDEKSFNDIKILNEIMELQDEAENIKSQKERFNFLAMVNLEVSNLYKLLKESFKQERLKDANKLNIKISYLNKIIKDIKLTQVNE